MAMQLLLIEDDASDAALVQHGLNGTCPGEFHIHHANSLEAALPKLSTHHFDVALLDLSLPASSDLEALKNLHNAAPPLPVVILTGRDDEALALSSLQCGAQDYLVKERAGGEEIKRAIRYAIERKRFEDNLVKLANYDALTGLINRSLFESRLTLALARVRRSGHAVAVLFLDLDGFKQVNDQFGHEAGDQLLKGVAERLVHSLRESDTIARFGGDEFAVLIEGDIEQHHCAVVAQRIIDALGSGPAAAVGASIGIALGNGDDRGECLLKQADEAMYHAKATGKNHFRFYTAHQQETAQAG